jgi:hypothetical protein
MTDELADRYASAREASRRDIATWRGLNGIVAGYRVLAKPDNCPACVGAASRRRLLAEDFDLPVPGCTCPNGCTCTLLPILSADW